MKTAFLALHGFTGSPSELGFLIERVERAGFPVRAPTLPGHGTTARDLQTRTWNDWLAHAKKELFEASTEPRSGTSLETSTEPRSGTSLEASTDGVVVCGFSMGTLLALALASDDETRGRVRALVLLGCAVRLSPPLRLAFRVVDKARALSKRETLPDAYVPKPLGPDIRDKTLASSIGGYDENPVRAAMEVYRAGRVIESRLHRVACPTLLLHGERDRVCDVRGAREVASALGTENVRVRTYARSGHMLALDFDREDVAQDVVQFLERV